MRLPQGFRAGGIAAGLKRSGRHDLGVVVADEPAVWALATTTNLVHAACVERNRSLLEAGGPVQAIVVNSGSANCATGEGGALDNEEYARMVASALHLSGGSDVLTASTGVVGVPLPLDGIRQGLPNLTHSLSSDGADFARAVITTDTVTKEVAAELPGGGRIVGVAKGSGMIHPNMATMLAFVLTDAKVEQEALRDLWRQIVARTFNQITVDGDTSPNDMAMLLSSGRTETEWRSFAAALAGVCRRLAQKIARDGEGATKLLTVKVEGARSGEEARAAARAVAGSPLVKAAVHGNDPNWGRILVALGRSGAQFDPGQATISLQGTTVYQESPVDFDAAEVSRALADPDVLIHVELGAGDGSGTAWGCDLSAEYVRINADYTT